MPKIELRSLGRWSTFVADRVGDVLERVPALLKGERYERIVDGVTVAGHWGLLAIALLGLVLELIAAVTGRGGAAILWGVAWLVVLPLLQYTALQFLGATRSMVTSNATSLGSQAFLRCYALVALVAAIVTLIYAIVRSIDTASVQVFLFGLAFTALWLATAWLALNPSLLGIRINTQSSAGEEAIGVLSFFVKAAVRIVPIFYGVTMVAATIHAIIVLIGMIGDTQAELIIAVGRVELTAPIVMLAALSPFLAYIGFVFYFLVIDLMRSVLSIPGNLRATGGTSGGSSGGSRTATGGSGGSRSSSGRASSKKKRSQ